MRILRKIKISEISAVDRPAQAHAKAVIMKRADDDDDVDFAAIAKAFVEEGVRTDLTKADFEGAITELSAAAYPDLSSAQQFTKFITEDSTGKMLFKASRLAATVEQQSQDIVPRQKSLGPNGDEVNALIERMMRNGLSMQESYARVIEDPRHKDLVAQYHEENRRATQVVADSRRPIRDAERLYSRDWRNRGIGDQRRV